MIVRGKSASGMARWNIDSAKDPLLSLSQHARQTWPDYAIVAITRGSPKNDNLLTSGLGLETFESAGVENGEVFFVEFGTASSVKSQLQDCKTSEQDIGSHISNSDAQCFNYRVFAYLRRYSSWFKPSEGLPTGHLQGSKPQNTG